jgi:tRNA (mo5U34)-methyltransferase
MSATPNLLERAGEIGWYHTLELAPGHVTEGYFDLRDMTARYGLPERMDGMRALDVGTWDGFWAFEMERRGAEVVALDLDDERDLDWPPRRRPATFPDHPRGIGFRLAHEIFDSKVERVNCSIYNALPEDLGTFDLVFCGSVLIHLRDQMLALERIANLCRDTFLSVEEYDRRSNFIPWPSSRFLADRDKAVVFWLPSIKAWKRMLYAAGFNDIEQRGKFPVKARAGWSVQHVAFRARKNAPG